MRLAHLVAAGAAFASLAAGGGLAAGDSGTLSIGDAQAREGTFGTRALSFRVTLSESSQDPVTVSYRTQNETARAGEDYDATQGTLQFAPGERTKNVEVQISGDRKVEPDEFFSVILFAPVSATIAQPGGVGTGTIENDDMPAVLCKCKRVKLASDRLRRTRRDAAHGRREGDDDLQHRRHRRLRGFVKAVSPFATLKPTPFTCRAKKCASTNTYTLRVRLAQQPLKKKLRLRAGCRGERGELRTFTLVFPK